MTIKEMRTASGMTQQQFSEELRIPKRSIENWEGEKRECPEYLLRLIEYYLKKENLIQPVKRHTKRRML
jgi:DNA-binding transcriptional regulator YiaG